MKINWDTEKHPRDHTGKFTDHGLGGPKSAPSVSHDEGKVFAAGGAYKGPLSHATAPGNADLVEQHGLKVGKGSGGGANYGYGIYLSTDDHAKGMYQKGAIKGIPKDSVTFDVYTNVSNPLRIDASKIRGDLDPNSIFRMTTIAKAAGVQDQYKAKQAEYIARFDKINDGFFDQLEAREMRGEYLEDAADEDRLWNQISMEIFGEVYARTEDPKYLALVDVLKDAGYDGIEIHGLKPGAKFQRLGGNQLLVFDEDKVRVVPRNRKVEATDQALNDGAELHKYWTQGAGLMRWAEEPRPYVALRDHLVRKGVTEAMANRVAAAWYKQVLGHWPSKAERKSGPVRKKKPVTKKEAILSAVDERVLVRGSILAVLEASSLPH